MSDVRETPEKQAYDPLGDADMTATHKEQHTGINGSGNTMWMVVTVWDNSGRWKHIEYFDNEPQADNWFKHS